MSTLTVEQHPVREAMDAKVAADLATDIVALTRSLFALAEPAASSASGPAGVNVPAPAVAKAPPPPALSIPMPAPITDPAHLPAVIPAAMPALTAIPLPGISATPLPSPDRPTAQPADTAGRETIPGPPRPATRRTMTMLSEIEFLDD